MTALPAVLAPVACAVVAAAVQPVVIGMLRWAAVEDIPGSRSSHTVATPRGGGVAVVSGLLVGLVAVGDPSWLSLGVGLLVFFAIGLVEDLVGVPIRVRLGLQLSAGAAVGLLLLRDAAIHATADPWVLAAVVVAIALWITTFTNAFNFMDGINGISAAHAIVGGMTFAVLGKLDRQPALVAVAVVVVAAGAGFLPWNALRARVFLGDVGSYALGAVLAILAVHALLRGVPPEAVLGPLALYLADTGWTLVRRIRRGAAWTQSHREHTYQRICDLGFSHQAVTLMTVVFGACGAALGMVSVVGSLPDRIFADLAALALLALYLAAPELVARRWSVSAA